MQLKDSVVLITGAANRVAREVALVLAKKGAHISFTYYLADEPWQETQKEIEDCGVKCMARQVEMRDSAQINAWVQDTQQMFGRMDVLINSAGIWLKTPFLEITEEDWNMELEVNLRGPFLCSKAVAPAMLKQGQGVIINVTDLSAFQVWPGYAHHASSKIGLVALTKSMAYELAPAIRVNAIAPGTVLLPFGATPEKIQWAVDKSVLKRVGTPADVADLAIFLIENDFATGSVHFIDGGRSLV
ncbi:MAG: SDR family oxidoreductase [Anaerolineaceae bacterium]|nr:SDR family oxidoreductase [Anaerolineaceae bacterium]